MKKVLLTGFVPFGKDKINPALELIKKMAKEEIPGIALTTIRLPVVFGEAITELISSIEKIKPDLILSLGQAAGRMVVSIERIGLNMKDTDHADNANNKPRDELIAANGPAAYFTTIDVRKTYQEMKKAGIPAIISNSAGTYVCNNLIYGVLHHLVNKNQNHIKYGFIHIPYLPSQAAEKPRPFASLPLDIIEKAVRIAINVNI
ncbi:MAG: pyroglutamyl-peptidase I [Candidatus Heimdallarchaeota archaeon]|nr:pyroglutamyl-peptidase I [Candidatus Heimdallarchaeota archaeon]MCK5185075.1 pyroglutamyl-peptidase I [Candidatus Heimdallarchaeota archaeon]